MTYRASTLGGSELTRPYMQSFGNIGVDDRAHYPFSFTTAGKCTNSLGPTSPPIRRLRYEAYATVAGLAGEAPERAVL